MLSNEELAYRIQQGETELIPQLWDQVVKFITAKAGEYISHRRQNGWHCDGDADDLINQAFFGFLMAIKTFKPETSSFLGILNLAIKTSFSEAAGYRRPTQRSDCAHIAVSGDAVIGDDGFSLFDVISDDQADPAERVTETLYIEQLRATLDEAMKQLPDKQERILRARYYGELTQSEIAKDLGCTSSNVGRLEQSALSALYAARFQNGLDQYLEENTNWYLHVGPKRFRNSRTSSVEEITFQREKLVAQWMKKHYGGGEHK